jgi:hypothetical protein
MYALAGGASWYQTLSIRLSRQYLRDLIGHSESDLRERHPSHHLGYQRGAAS